MKKPTMLAALFLACLVTLAWSGARYASARGDLHTATARYASVASNVAEIQRLRGTQATIASAARPQPNLSGQISDTLVEAGLSPNLLTSLAPDPDMPVTIGSSHDYRRQSARLTLDPLSVPDLGRFLGSWTSAQPEWTVSAITMTPITLAAQPRANGVAPGRAEDDRDAVSPNRRVRAVLTIECLYLDRSASPEPNVNPNLAAPTSTP